MDGGAGLAGDRRDINVCGEMGGVLESADVVADGEEFLACGPGRYPWHAGQHREKRGVDDCVGDCHVLESMSSRICVLPSGSDPFERVVLDSCERQELVHLGTGSCCPF